VIVTCTHCGELIRCMPPAAAIDAESRQALQFRLLGDSLAVHFRARHADALNPPIGVGMMLCHYLLALQAHSTDPEFGAIREKVRLQLAGAVAPIEELQRIVTAEVQAPGSV
jgi:hypothetical protein